MASPSALPAVSRRLTTLFNLLFNYASVLLVVVQGIVLMPLYRRHVPDALLGAWMATGNLLTWLELVDPGTSDVIRQRVAHHYGANDRAALARTIGTGIRLSLGFACIPLLGWPFADLACAAASDLTRLSPADAASLVTSFRVGLLGVSLSLASYGFSAVCSGLQLALKSGLFFIATGVLSIVITVVMVLLGYGLVAIPTGLAVRAALMSLSFAWLVYRWKREHLPEPMTLDPVEARQVLSLTATTFTSRLGTTLLDRLDASLIARVLGNTQTFTYGVTGRALEPVRMVSVSLPTSLMPSLSHMVGAGERTEIARVVALLSQVTGTFVAVGAGSVAALDAVFVRVWLGPAVFGGPDLIALLAVSTSLSVFAVTLNRVVSSLGAIRQAAWVSLAEAVVKVPLQFFLLRRLGLIGLPIATCVGAMSVSGWYLPSLVARLVDEPPWRHVLRNLGNAARVVVAVLIGRALHTLIDRLPVAWTVGRFVVAAVVVGAFFSALGLATDRHLFERLRAALRRKR